MHTTTALKRCTGMLALLWATAVFAAPAGTASSEAPSGTPGLSIAKIQSIRIQSQQNGLAGTCGGAAFDVNTNINVSSQASAEVGLSAAGVGVVEAFTDETGKNIGPYAANYPTFHIPAFGGGLAPNTLLTLTITTYSGPTLTGSITFTSTMVFNCTTGVVISAAVGPTPTIPALSQAAIGALATLLALFGALVLRRREHVRRKGHR